ncbi:hypothetical protein SNE40_016793 [Patella caerulea]|uniref:HTH psq-type domain-containing protein n=1 Tax=Patella caerulea TaxID=87958 RepID=A0AAN8JCK2_PATCE
MACSYKRRVDARAYKHYTEDTLKTAVNQIVSKKISLRKASRHFGIPTGTLSNRLNKKHNIKPGHPPVFTDEEGKSFVKHLQVVGEWGFPFDNFDIRIFVKNYLASKGKKVPQFVNNCSSTEWAVLFFKRYKDQLTYRTCQNIKRSSCSIS